MNTDYLDFQKGRLKAFAVSKDRADVVIKKAYFPAPTAGTATAVLAATTLVEDEITEVTENITQPDMPRVLTVTGNAAGIIGDVVIEGYDYYNTNISETIALDGTTTVSGEKAFKYITKITLPVRVTAEDAVSVGTGDKLGLREVVKEGVVLLSLVDGVEETTKAIITKNESDISKNLIEFDTAFDGTKNFTCYFLDR